MILWYVAIVSVLTFALYGWDKACARNGRARVPEAVLLGLGLIGGTPGGFVGMRYFRHKTSKTSFLLKFWACVLVQIWLVMFAPDSIRMPIVRIIAKIMG